MNDLIKISPTVELSLDYQDNFPLSLKSAAKMVVTSVANALVREGLNIAVAIVQKFEESRVKIAFYQERSHCLREYIIPTVALYDAVQAGINFVNNSNWDEPLKQMALEDLYGVLHKYRTK